MVRPLMIRHGLFQRRRRLPADADDITVADDLLDTLKAHEDGCVGMAANMIGVNKAIIVFDNDGTPCEMFNPVIVYRKGLYLAEEGCLSLQGSAGPGGIAPLRCSGRDRQMQTHVRNFTGWTARSSSMRSTIAAASLYNKYARCARRGAPRFLCQLKVGQDTFIVRLCRRLAGCVGGDQCNVAGVCDEALLHQHRRAAAFLHHGKRRVGEHCRVVGLAYVTVVVAVKIDVAHTVDAAQLHPHCTEFFRDQPRKAQAVGICGQLRRSRAALKAGNAAVAS